MNNYIFGPADILLPKSNFEKWSVIACDQFTSSPEYWERVADAVGAAPSTLKLILPEVYLGRNGFEETVGRINCEMNNYLENGIYNVYPDAFVLVKRKLGNGKIRYGIVGCADLAQYDYSENSKSRIRATEKTVVERLPVRIKIRENASTELPHTLMLIDDAQKSIIEPLAKIAESGKMQVLYDFELMLGGGHLTGYLVPREMNDDICRKIENLGEKHGGMTLAVGDGNHSFASAKECYEQTHSAEKRYSLCEIVNLHSDALEFEPIYRTVENVDPENLAAEFTDFLKENGAEVSTVATKPGFQKITLLSGMIYRDFYICNPPHSLEVGTVQMFLDFYKEKHPGISVDYIHGTDEVKRIASGERKCGFLYMGIGKNQLFSAIEKDGVLPRKTFSMGSAKDKRYYTEARRIIK